MFILKIQFFILVSAGFIKSQKNNADNRTISESLATYVEYFEKPFLRDTKQFYKIESNNFFENNSVNDYIKKVKINESFQMILEENCSFLFIGLSTFHRRRSSCKQCFTSDNIREITSFTC
jgi:hypothetical protein